jgi:hypothetical protein
MENWKKIVGYEGLYEVSDLGNVRSLDKVVPKWDGFRLLKGRVLKKKLTQFGYHSVALTKNGKPKHYFVHRLVATCFIDNPDTKTKTQVNHIDGNKTNNAVDNLEWVSASENIKHAFKTGLKSVQQSQIDTIRTLGKNSNKKVLQMDLDGNVVKEWNSMTDASKTLKINLSCISMCCKGTRKKAGGFAWKYSECRGDSND